MPLCQERTDTYDRQSQSDAGKAEGKVEGKAEDIILLLSESGYVSEELCNKIRSQRDEEVLKIWLRTAAKVESIEEFVELLQITL